MVFLLLYFFSVEVKAHNPVQAFFEIKFSKDSCIVEAEFPWTLRNAFLAEYPEFEHKSQDFDITVNKYLQEHFIIKNAQKKLVWQIRQEKAVHPHSVKYIFSAQLSKFEELEIQNTCMLNLYKKHINFHKVFWKHQTFNFQTSQENSSFTLNLSSKKKEKNIFSKLNLYISIISLSLIIILFLVFVKRKQ